MATRDATVDYYGAQYGHFDSRLSAEIRAATFGQDIGQNGWLTSDEHDLLISWLALGPESRLLDVACGSGGPTLRIARVTGCTVHGVDVHEDGIAAAHLAAAAEGLSESAAFSLLDAGRPMPFPASSFDALICVDAVNHLPHRDRVFREWARLLRPGGRLVFTDPVVITGPLTNEELAIRSSIGFFLFVPPGWDERWLDEAGFDVMETADRTANMARIAGKWHDVRASRAEDLRRVEGEDTFSGQQRFLDVTAMLAREGRLSRTAFLAVRRDGA